MSSRGPAYSVARHLAIDTPSPPVAETAVWLRQYPIPSSPWHADAPRYLNLAQGVPSGMPTAAMRGKMAEEAAKDKHHSYGPANPGLMEALARNLNAVYRDGDDRGRGAVTTSDICLTAGCNMASEFAFRTVAELGANHGVVLPTPFYFNHSMQLLSLAIAPIPLPCSPSNGYLPSPTDFNSLLAKHRADSSLPEVRALVLVTPNNPTGAIYPAELIGDFAKICKQEKVALILDETYRDMLVPEGEEEVPKGGSIKQVRPHDLFSDELEGDTEWQWRDAIIHLYSFSKSFAIPGHRLGAMVTHPHLISYATASSPGTTAEPRGGGGESVPTESTVAPPTRREFGPLAKAQDNTLICAPRTDVQAAVGWAIEDPGEVAWRRDTGVSLVRRARLLKEGLERQIELATLGLGLEEKAGEAKSPAELGWKVESVGGYYAFVSHPFPTAAVPSANGGPTVSSTQVARGLALLFGLGILPGDMFVPAPNDKDDEQARESLAIGARHIRLSNANVTDEEALRTELPRRLVALTRLWEVKGCGWGV
ncbi:PLP-dependent transferase [Jaminaea rosea]|uniref:PLP-dependent transferase n=1 Tax=Jaminaea rosea TaxID=1569628 RepID=A0A316V234_9BASI|nr:PLP-dependent transferase [Jaminaea rosea]PWN30243.1 PLP-dependent transferase [Jaminaea rosea]